VELVVVLVIASILGGAMAVFGARAMEGYRDVTRRAMLIDVAESALRRIGRDVRRALPNSIRVDGSTRVLELLHAADGARYRRRPGTNPGPVDHLDPGDWLSFTTSGDVRFNLLGRLGALPFSYGAALPAGTRLAIYPTGSSVYADAASGANPGVITPAGTQLTISDDTDEDQIELDAPYQFRFESPRQRVYVVDTPVTYLCDLSGGTVTRYSGYTISQTQPTAAGAPPLSSAASALVTHHVTGCTFTYQPGTSQRAGLVTMEMQIAQAGEQVRLLHQIHVENAP
jgi:MSHA biogenesis protein MshO